MPDPGDDIEARLTVLEREVARLREQTVLANSEGTAARAAAAAARVLAGGADREVSEVRAELREGFAEMRAEMREGFAKQATGMAQITALLTMIAGPENPVGTNERPASNVARQALI